MAPSDHDLGTALRALTTDQPPQPVDRLAAVTRRGQRIRRTRAVTAVAASVVLAAGVLLGVASLRPQGEERMATTPIAQWPDRSLKGQTGVAEGALAAWRQQPGASSLPVRWLFRGSLPVPDHDDVYAAVFLSSRDGIPVLVASTTRRAQVDDHGLDRQNPQGLAEGSSPWVARTAPVTSAPDHVGLYLEYGGPALEDLVFVLADPSARTLTWRMAPLPYAVTPADVASDGRITGSHDGVFFGPAGVLTGRVTVTVTDAAGRVTGSGDLGGAFSEPGLSRPPAPEVPARWHELSSSTSQSELQPDGSWSGLGMYDYTVGLTGKVTGYVRCYGGGSMGFTLTGHKPTIQADGHEVPLATGRASCDGQTHQAFPPHVVPHDGYDVVSTTDRLQVYALRLGTVR